MSTRLRDISAQQWKSGIAAWLGWLFDGFDMHLYTLVALPFVGQLLGQPENSDDTKWYSSLIQASFLVGWALGGGFFGRLGDLLGRSRALMLTILTYALFTGLSFFATQWWHLLAFRFLAALGIGGEWAVGAALLSETWPQRWRPWLAAVLQSAVTVGILLAMFVGLVMRDLPYNTVFLVGIVPALLVVWIRRAVPETETWQEARRNAGEHTPRVRDLFGPGVLPTTVLTLLVCGLSLTAHWALMFWAAQHVRGLPETQALSAGAQTALASQTLIVIIAAATFGNFLAGWLAKLLGYRRAIVLLFLAYFATMFITYRVPRDFASMYWWLAAVGACQGVFGLFTMYMPPLFPTLLRTTGAGFCYNFGRIAAAVGTVYFGMFGQVGDFRHALLYSSFLFLPAAAFAMLLREPPAE